MRNLIIATAILFMAGAEIVNAQSIQEGKDNYLVISKNIQQLKPIILTAQDLGKSEEQSLGEFHVLICGKTVKDISGNEAFKELLEEARKQRIQVLVCGLSLSKFDIGIDQLPDDLTIVDNGILHALQLKKKGFITLTI